MSNAVQMIILTLKMFVGGNQLNKTKNGFVGLCLSIVGLILGYIIM